MGAPLTLDLTEVLKDAPVGDWIALSHTHDRIIATGSDLSETLHRARELGEIDPIMTKVPSTSVLIL